MITMLMIILVIMIQYGDMSSMGYKFIMKFKYIIMSSIFIILVAGLLILKIQRNNSITIVNNNKYDRYEMQAKYIDFDSLLKELGYDIEVINHNDFSDEDINIFLYYSVGAGEERWELLEIMCMKGGDWHNLPISQEVKDKYEKSGLLPNEKFDRIEFWEYNEFERGYYYETGGLSSNPRFIIWDGDIEKKVELSLNKNKHCRGILTVDDINILTKEESENLLKQREEQYHILPQYELSDKNWERCVFWLQFENIFNNSLAEPNEAFIAKTEKFKDRYPIFFDIFEHYSPQKYNNVELIEFSDYKDLTAKYRVRSSLENKIREYEVKFILDENLYIDDVNVVLLSEKYGTMYDFVDERFLYKNSYIVGANISKKVRDKYEKTGSYNEDIDIIDIDIPMIYRKITDDGAEKIQQFTLKDGTIAFYYVNIIKVESDTFSKYERRKIEDIICYKLPYENLLIDDVLEQYLMKK